MAVQRYDLNKCIGCMNCVTVCPMDVFRFDYEANKSVLAYPENCQSCGQCFVGCQGRSLVIAYTSTMYQIPAIRGVATDDATPEKVNAAIVQKLYDDEAAAAAEAEGGESEGGESSSK